MLSEKKTTGNKAPGAAPFVPAHASLAELREALAECRGCDLYRNATQAVFGEGRARARIVIGRRAAWGSGGSGGLALCRSGGTTAGSGLGGSGDRAGRGLSHQRGEAFQIRRARQAAHSQEAVRGRDYGLQAVARGGTGVDQAGIDRMPGGYGRAVGDWETAPSARGARALL